MHKIKLQYLDVTTPTLTILTGGKVEYARYKLNSAYDPDFGSLNKTSPGFVEWVPFYNRYQVTWVRLTCTFVSRSTIPLYVGIVFRPVTEEATWNNWEAFRDMEVNAFHKKNFLLSSEGGTQDRITLSIASPAWKIFGNKREYYGNTNWSAQMQFNPLSLLEGIAYVAMPTNDAAGTNLYQVVFNCKMTQYVKLYQRKLLKAQTYGTGDLTGFAQNDTGPETVNPNNLTSEDPDLGAVPA